MLSRFIPRILCSLFAFTTSALAFSADIDAWATEATMNASCSSGFTLVGASQVRVQSSHEYSIWPNADWKAFSWSVTFTIRRDGTIIETIRDRNKYLRYFVGSGVVSLEAMIVPDDRIDCSLTLTKNIHVYQSVITHITESTGATESNLSNIFDSNAVLYVPYVGRISDASQGAPNTWSYVSESDYIVISRSDVLWAFSEIAQLQKTQTIDLRTKQLFIVSDYRRSFLSKVLAFYLSQIWAEKVQLVSKSQYYELMNRLANGESVRDFGEEISYEKGASFLSISRLIEFLAYGGIPYEVIMSLLSVTLVVLVFNILKQVVGLNVFGMYYPIMLALTMTLLGWAAIVFLAIGVLSILSTQLLCKKIHLLSHARRALFISLYVVMTLLALGVGNYFWLSIVNYRIFSDPSIVLAMFILVLVSDKMLQIDDGPLWGKSGLRELAQYIIVVSVAYGIIESTIIGYFLISYPDSIVAIVIANIIVGRYIGLQIVEYIRFSPLLRNLQSEEE